jgi:peptidyl-dipeptidase Dcp
MLIAPRLRPLTLSLACVLFAACSTSPEPSSSASAPVATATEAAVSAKDNPIFAAWKTPFAAIPFDQITLEHVPGALDAAMQEQLLTVNGIAEQSAAPTVENTLEALERANAKLRRVGAIFSVFTSNLSNDAVRKVEAEYAAKLAAHSNKILLNPKLFARIKALHGNPATAQVNPEAARLAQQSFERMQRAGAALDEVTRGKVAALTEREASLMTQFNQNVQKDTDAFVLLLNTSDLDGLPAGVRDAAAQSAKDRGHEGQFAFTLQRPDVEAFLTFSDRRDLREKLFKAFTARGENANANNNGQVIAELARIRAERAVMLGHANHAELVASESMAKTADAARDLLMRVWTPALAQAKRDREVLSAKLRRSDAKAELQAWDWRYFAEQVRAEKFALDQSEVAPYFGLENMLQASFYVSEQLFGVRFSERKDIPVYHPDVRVFEVKDLADTHVGLFYIDYFARQGKRSGAWMANYRPQQLLDGSVDAQVVNNLNIAKPSAGKPALISLTEATTLFHELGHGLHGLLSNVRYPSLSGTSVPRDFVEFPAQFMEHYVLQPQVLRKFAKHVETQAVIPDALIEKIRNAERFNQGFATVEFVASALVDHAYHRLTPAEAASIDAAAFERDTMSKLGAIAQIPMRHRSPHFSHVFGGGYSAAYYAYMWSEVLDTDGFAAFSETGDIFDSKTAQRLKSFIYERGNTLDWSEAYRQFRGRDPQVEPLLRNRGLLDS